MSSENAMQAACAADDSGSFKCDVLWSKNDHKIRPTLMAPAGLLAHMQRTLDSQARLARNAVKALRAWIWLSGAGASTDAKPR